MVKSFVNNYRNSNSINGEKAIENFLINNNEEDGSSIFINRIREQDLSAEQKLNELKGFIEELARKAEFKKIELERQAASCIDETLSQVELQIKDNEDYFTDNNQGVFANFFESLFNLFEVNVDPRVYKMLKEKKEKNLLLSIIKFLRDKFKELVKKIFKKDLSWDKRLDKEIKELQEKLLSGGLSPEEEIAILERLQALQNLKLKLQTFFVGFVIAMFAEIFAVDLAAVVEQDATEKKENKKAEKTESKEVRKEVETKVNEITPISLFDFSSQVPMPITLSKQERALLPKPIEKLVNIPPKPVINHKNSEVQKQEKVNKKEEKTEKPKLAVCPPAPQQKEHRRIRRNNKERDTYGTKRIKEPSAKSQQKAANAAVELPGGLTGGVRVENHASSVKERGV
ncbi:hypothetical protein HGO53_03135 [Wolbachia endosymbiont of Diaphorina citri]|uniref:hypothetical protein n=1 Tax=Wolbachia endosymbiont of Diaphorina citri TaxID=116598 RepID=UPI00155E2EF5|nr:hypothetical protein [Wolbachia endosymbiont of Diaphorina citri]QJT95544.1 hypothetical protein HGO49_02425 [Wolbachia endosymbiont of Diaphorina citri]QJT96905.1 hypothetical protein HGO53_03135 [Wolbachia endosymbiont of Diaphorina citri]QXY87268.1 hypothetical protein GZ064_05300 [Wolbachia endosymbiont of Diaphorina citri]QXY88480.1 hypothetical protein GZ065_05315 [Wolbachia endosymbiont of Diaphorina citri]QXY89283.1 hypothetical protein GZ066_02645 [Wolbachia endosymbiont of Diaphor